MSCIYSIEFTKRAEKDLSSLEEKDAIRIIRGLERICIRPFRYLRKLRGDHDLYRLRVGEYRVIIQLREGEKVIYVLKVGHRKNIYDGF